MSFAQNDPHLIVTVDTEEEGLWNRKYQATGQTTENLRFLPRFHRFCEEFKIAPTYLIDAPVLTDDQAVERLAAWQESGRCEVGAHCHPWCNPPLRDDLEERLSYLCNLPLDVQREKLVWLTETIERRVGRRPTSFRAGRYGLDARGASILAELGYVVDSSVVPFTDYSSSGGPDFNGAPVEPYWIGRDLARPAETGPLLEVPVSLGYSRRNFEAAHALRVCASRAPWNRLRTAGMLDRSGIARRVKLSPEQATSADLRRLATHLFDRGVPCLVLMLHSSSLMAGGSPYVPDAASLERLYVRLEIALQFCRDERRMKTATLSEFARAFARRRLDANVVARRAGHGVGDALRGSGERSVEASPPIVGRDAVSGVP